MSSPISCLIIYFFFLVEVRTRMHTRTLPDPNFPASRHGEYCVYSFLQDSAPPTRSSTVAPRTVTFCSCLFVYLSACPQVCNSFIYRNLRNQSFNCFYGYHDDKYKLHYKLWVGYLLFEDVVECTGSNS